MEESNVWLWKEPDFRWKKDVTNFIKGDKDIVVLHCIEVEGFDESIPLANFTLNLAEELGIFKRERTMFLNPKDLSQAIELCLERLDKEIQVTDEDIIKCHKDYVEHFKCEGDVTDKRVLQLKTFIEENNCADLWLLLHLLLKSETNIIQHLSQKTILILEAPQSDVFRNIILMMAPEGNVSNVVVETPLNISLQKSPSRNSPSLVEVTAESLNVNELPIDAENQTILGSATEEYVEDIITSFFSLLVNSRNELALAKVMISPIVDLGHDAFTELKHLAGKKEMPMCQTALSYVTRLQLGGKGYAPAPDCPLLPHFKKLEVFVNTLNQMQTLIEEDLTPVTAVKRLINILKKKLLKSGSDKLKESAIESASENLKGIAVKMLNIMKPKECSVSAPQVCQENLDFLHRFVNYTNCRCLTFDLKNVLLQKQTKRTPISLPPLLGYFRSPEEESSCDVESVLDEDSLISNNSTSVHQHMPYFHFSESSSVPGSCVDASTPSKTNFKGCLPIENNNENPVEPQEFKIPKKSYAKKGRKRSILGEITNENLSCETKKAEDGSKKVEMETTKKGTEKKMKLSVNNSNAKADKNVNKAPHKKEPKAQNKTKVSKKHKLIEGQGKITSFFSMK